MEPMNNPCGSLRTSLGPYVVGALEPAERAEVEAHLAVCAVCRDELAVLAGLPGLLGRLNEEEAVASGRLAAPSDLVERALAQINRGRRDRRRRSRLVAAAVLAIVLGAGGLAVGLQGQHPSGSFSIAGVPAGRVTAADQTSGVRGTATLLSEPWGSAIKLLLSGVAPGDHCQLIAIARDGHHEVAGTWNASYGGIANVSASTAIPPAQLAALRVVTTSGADLITFRAPASSRSWRR